MDAKGFIAMNPEDDLLRATRSWSYDREIKQETPEHENPSEEVKLEDGLVTNVFDQVANGTTATSNEINGDWIMGGPDTFPEKEEVMHVDDLLGEDQLEFWNNNEEKKVVATEGHVDIPETPDDENNSIPTEDQSILIISDDEDDLEPIKTETNDIDEVILIDDSDEDDKCTPAKLKKTSSAEPPATVVEADPIQMMSQETAAQSPKAPIQGPSSQSQPLQSKGIQCDITAKMYDPVTAKQQDFYGDVQRTVGMFAKTLEEMPVPGELDFQMKLPPKLVNLYNHQRYGLRWLMWREGEFPGGGILADEMGLGKTIMIIALIMKSKVDDKAKDYDPGIKEAGKLLPCGTTLIICPASCLNQWKSEVLAKGQGLSVFTYYGVEKTSSAVQLAKQDVVLTTYTTIRNEMANSFKETPLKRLYWRRIVLDEAHIIRNPKTDSSKTVCKLQARHRWAVTGTPVHNRPEDFFSLIKFLRMIPFDNEKVFDFWIGLKQVRKETDCRDRLHTLAKSLILRRTKAEVEEQGGAEEKIPPKTVDIVEVELSEEEREVYEHLLQFSKNMFADYLASRRDNSGAFGGDDSTQEKSQFLHIFTLLMRLRQCAVLPYLIHTMLEDYDENETSNVSLEEFEELKDDDKISLKNPVFGKMFLSSKYKKILEDLEHLREEAKQEGRAMDKVVVVSCWTTTLEILSMHLQGKGFGVEFITGKETIQLRAENQKKFNQAEDPTQILLLSLGAGGVGLNLVGGNHVIFMEPHWNPQLELQAQDRVHRFGQSKPVIIKRYITTNTVEERILKIQQDKRSLADGVLDSASKRNRRGAGTLSIAQLKMLFK